LPRNVAGNVIGRQVLASGTSVGANYREANRSVSKADFKNKIAICEKEASETQYWLEVLVEAKVISSDKTELIYKECRELVSIFTVIGKKLR
jgi:four helix bundle protein